MALARIVQLRRMFKKGAAEVPRMDGGVSLSLDLMTIMPNSSLKPTPEIAGGFSSHRSGRGLVLSVRRSIF
jgi:hypothetical protein